MRHLTSLLTAFCCVLTAAASAQAQDDEIAQLIRDLSANQSGVRSSAADALAKYGPRAKAAAGALTQALSGGDQELCWRAARAIGAIGPAAAEAVPALTRLLTADEPRVRAYAAFALGRIGEASIPAAKELVKLGFDKDKLVRRATVDALLRIQAPGEDTLPVIIKLLEAGEPDEVMPALHAMAEAGERVVPRLCRALQHDKACYWACVVLGEIGPAAKAAVPDLVKVLQHRDAEVRLQALVALGEIGEAARPAAPAIVKALETDSSAGVRYAAAYALGKIGDKEQAQKALLGGLESEDEFLRVVSGWALAQLDPENKELVVRCANQIAKGLKSKDENVRRAAARALAESSAPPEIVAPVLIEALNESDEHVLNQAVSAFASLGAKAVPRLIRGLQNEKLKLVSARVIARIGPEAKEAAPLLAKALLTDTDPEYRREVQYALGAIGPEAAEATPALVKSVSNENEKEVVRYSACYALGKIGPAAWRAAPALRKNLRSKDEFLRLASVWALLRVCPDDKEIPKIAIGPLVLALRDDREMVRVEAAATLGDLGEIAKPGLVQLKKALDDPSPAVREAAAAAIAKIEK